MYYRLNELAPQLTRAGREEERRRATSGSTRRRTRCCCPRTATRTPRRMLARGRACCPRARACTTPHNITLMHHLYAALRAHTCTTATSTTWCRTARSIIVDEFTGRLMPGRRWSDGLHQAVEAKEGVHDPAREPDARVDHVPELLPHVRQAGRHDRHGRHRGLRVPGDLRPRDGGHPDAPADDPQGRARPASSRRASEKYEAVIDDIRDCHERGQPVLVGTTSIENSELLSGMLEKAKLPHQVLNAKQHAREAEIVAQAGRPERDHHRHQHGRPRHRHRAGRQRRERRSSCVEADEALAADEKERAIADSCATSGRALHDEVVKARAACTSSAPSATSRGASTTSCAAARAARATRARSRFYLSLEDPLMRIFAGERVQRDHGAAEDARRRGDRAPASSTRSIESAQRKVEARNFDIRKQLLEYDDVANDQRKVIYQQRNDLLEARRHRRHDRATCAQARSTTSSRSYVPAESVEEQWDLPGLETALRRRVAARRSPVARVARRTSTSSTDEDDRRARRRRGRRAVRRQGRAQVGAEQFAPVRAQPDAADARHALARAPGGARLPAPGHPPARLCAEEPEAGIQARGVRAVLATCSTGSSRTSSRSC